MRTVVGPGRPESPIASVGPILVDVGGEFGALIVYAPGRLLDAEVEISREGTSFRSHAYVLARSAGSSVHFAAVYPRLAAGRYRLWSPDGRACGGVTVTGGRVSETSLAGANWPPGSSGS